jgi:predicted O-methyltransferase YrrM
MNPVLQDILETQSVPGPDGRRHPLHSHVPPLEGQIMQAWISKFQPSRFLEIGLGYGISTHYICDAIQNLTCFESYAVVDPYQLSGFNDLGLYNLQRAGYEALFTLHRELSEAYLPRIWSAGAQLDFVLIDGGHTFENVFIDYFYASRMLVQGGLLLFDDVEFAGVKWTIDYVESRAEFQRLALPEGFEQNKAIRVRQLSGKESSRIVGFQKV